MSEETPLWISESDVVSELDMRGAIAALEQGLLAEAAGDARNMVKTHVEWEGGSTLHAIGAVFSKAGLVGTKTWAHTPGGATPLLVLFDGKTGALRAIIEAFALGQLRTAGASGLATQWLAAPDADDFAILGTGKQALPQVAAVLAVRPVRRIRVFGRNEERRDRFVARLSSALGVAATAAGSVADAVRGASIITVVTRATEPILSAGMVARGAHINAVGAIVPSRAEIAADVLARSTCIAVDSVPQAQKLSRELMDFFGKDPSHWQDVKSLASVVASRRARQSDDDLTLFKSLGMGISDLAVGIEIYRKVREAGKGRPIPQPQKVVPRLRPQRAMGTPTGG
jgi:ornithine cyclodeaminase/alanine dehydrogenase-like protein (mu-crystallin family)